uniref:Flagellar export chaperone FlgN n=1 Tax=Anoxynatronum sibiricum TaxID=210623 RepID=A0ABU9VUA5_9CLOT
MDINETVNNLTQYLNEKQGILKDLLRFTMEQKEILNTSEDLDLEAFTLLLTERGRLMEQADKVDALFLTAFQSLKEHLGISSMEEIPAGEISREQVQGLQGAVGQVQQLLKAIQQVDDENRETMKKQMASLKKEITQVQQGKKAIHGYANTKQPQPSLFMDQKEKPSRRK